MRLCVAALCLAAMACRDRGPDPRLDMVEPGECYSDEDLVLVLRGSFGPPVQAELGDPTLSRVLRYQVQLESGDRVFLLPAAEYRGAERVETDLDRGTPPGLYTVRLTDPWGRSVSLPDALTVRFRYAAPVIGDPVDIDPPVTGPVRSPPMAGFVLWNQGNQGFAYDWGWGILGSALQAEASLSTDSQTPAATLTVSWNFSGNTAVAEATWPTATAPWMPWTTTKSAQSTMPYGTQTLVLAVRDGDGDISYRGRAVSVVANTEICFVTGAPAPPLPPDDGATGCTDAKFFGNDGVLSLEEALRLTASPAVNETILLYADPNKPPLTLTGPPLPVSSVVQIVGMPGVILGREIIAQSSPVTLIGMDVAGHDGKLTVPAGMKLVLLDSRVRDTTIVAAGSLIVERTRFERCAGACITVDGPNAEVVVSESTFQGSGAEDAVVAPQCVSNGSGYSLDVVGNTFTAFSTAIRVGIACDRPTRIAHNTFHANGVAIDYLGGTAHVLRNNIFTAQQYATVWGCSGSTVRFGSGERRDHLLYGNASDGCIRNDPGIVAVNPLFVSSLNRDFRLRYGSPAINVAPAFGMDVNGSAPNAYQGSAPDFGGRETY